MLEQLLTEVPVDFLGEWIPERMDPGTIFVLKGTLRFGDPEDPYIAVMSCPRCGTLGLMTRQQLYGGKRMICGGSACSAEFSQDGETVNYRAAQ